MTLLPTLFNYEKSQLSSADIPIKVTLLPLIFAVYPGLSIVNVYRCRNSEGFLTVFNFWIWSYIYLLASGRSGMGNLLLCEQIHRRYFTHKPYTDIEKGDFFLELFFI